MSFSTEHVFELKPIETLAILGLGKSCYDWILANHSDFVIAKDNIEIWTINMGCGVFRHDVVWDMHTKEYLQNKYKNQKIDHIWQRRDWLKTHDKPVVMPFARPEIPTSLTFNLKEAVDLSNSCYYSTGIAYLLVAAYCIHKKFGSLKTLKLFGCDFSYARDYNTHDEQGRACAEYWLGRLIERGVRVEVTTNTHMLDMLTRSKGYIYGYHEQVEFEFPLEGGMGRFIGPDYTVEQAPKPVLITPEYLQWNADEHIKDPAWGDGDAGFNDWVEKTIAQYDCKDILDYGAGKATLEKAFPNVCSYDPAIPRLANKPKPADLVVSRCTLEHIEPDCLENVLDDIKQLAKKAVLFVVSCYPSSKTLPDGRNAHLIMEPMEWWLEYLNKRWEPELSIKFPNNQFLYRGVVKHES